MKKLKSIRISRRRVLFAIIILTAIGIGFYLRQRSKNNQAKVESTEIKKGTVSEELILSGTIIADQAVTLQFQTSGLLTYVGVKEGDRVKKGKLLASLDTRSIKKNLQKYLNIYTKSRNTFEQTNDDNENPVTTPDQAEIDRISRILAGVQMDLNNSVLDVELTDIALGLSNLTTPIAGIVTTVTNPIPGVNISSSTTKFEVVNPDTLYFEVTADQTDIVNVKEGQTVKIILDSFDKEESTGKVDYISFAPVQSETGAVYIIKVKLDNQESLAQGVRLGMTGDARFLENQKENVLYVSNNFVNTDDNGKYLKINKPDNKVYIQTGLEGEENTEITGDIKEGDKVFE